MLRFADARAWLGALDHALLEPACLLCDAPVTRRDADALVCGLCRLRWPRVEPPWCPRCGATVDGDDPCTLCAAWPAGLGMVRSAVWLDESARRAVHALKYGGWRRVAEPMARAMHELEPLGGAPMLVAVPLGSRRLRRRGYNQSDAIADALAARRALATRPSALRRARETRSQTTLTPEARAANVAGAFEASGVRGAHLVLVDDVFTTGATLAAAGAALAAAGAARVDAVTFARARITFH